MIFKSLRLSNWRQYRELDVSFHERLTVLTGANGAGKTTVLNLLSRHFGWQGSLVSTPRRQKGGTTFHPGNWTDDSLAAYEEWLDDEGSLGTEPPAPPVSSGPEQEIGALTYANDVLARLTVPPTVGASFNVNIHDQREQKGLHIPSHRPIFSYQTVENIPTVPRRRDQAFSTYMEIVRARHYGQHHQRTPNYFMKETLIALAAFGHGNAVIERDLDSLAVFTGFEDVLKTILPPSLGFTRLAVRLPEVVLVTRSGDFSLDAVSGGISSLVDLAWQVFMYAPPETPFAVTIDEPENHLHPELQRTVLSSFIRAFPHVQFICATHSPFIVTAVPDANTYALRYGADHHVRSELLSAIDRSGSSNEVLRDVLGLPSSSPTWVETKLSEIQNQLSANDLTPELLTELRESLTAVGLERFVPLALAQLAERQMKQ